MKKFSLYQCEICGTRYDNEETCVRCESRHIFPVGLSEVRYTGIKKDSTGYPEAICVRMSDGNFVVYKKQG